MSFEITAFNTRPLGEIIDYILPNFHQKHRSELPLLIELAEKVENRHADHPACPKGLAEVLRKVYDDLSMHMMKEEQVLFPLIQSGRGAMAAAPISVMEAEHAEAHNDLAEIIALTHEFTLPEGACTSWQNLYNGLRTFSTDLTNHTELENEVLFVKALRGDAA